MHDVVKDGLSTAMQHYFDKDRHSGEDHSREVAAARNIVLKSGPVISCRGLFHKTKQLSVMGEHGWRIETIPTCASETTKFDEGACHQYPTVQEAQDARCKPCPDCYPTEPRNLMGML